MESVQITVAWARVPCLVGGRDGSSSALCICPEGRGWHSWRTRLPLIFWAMKSWRDAERGEWRGRGGGCRLLLACSVNQNIRFCSMATVTILPGAINQGEENTHHPAARAAIPQASPSTPPGTARAPPATFWLPFLALCCDSNAKGVASEGERWEPPRQGWAEKCRGSWSLGLLHSTFGQEIDFAQRSSPGEGRGGRKDGAC